MPALPRTVLIIEDDPALSDAFGMILKFKGYEVVAAFNGRQALDWLKDNKAPDVILLDILMPVMDGREFLSQYANSDNVPVIALSNLDAKTDIEQILTLGATTYALKSSVTPDTLAAIIDEQLATP